MMKTGKTEKNNGVKKDAKDAVNGEVGREGDCKDRGDRDSGEGEDRDAEYGGG